jgi:anti-anti-sigma factor
MQPSSPIRNVEDAERHIAPTRSRTSQFRIEVHHQGEVAQVVPVGELDLATVRGLGARLRDVAVGGVRRLVLDLRQLTFMDSAGLHLVLTWDAWAREHDAEFNVIQGRTAIRRIFEITGTLQALPFIHADPVEVPA